MLDSIVINNFTIIDRNHIEFNPGMTALTGETGAGKSILLDAIKLVLGDRADSDTVKSGADKADITVGFDLTSREQARHWLKQNELDNDGECLIRRVVQANGRSKAFINGTPATLNQLKILGEMLVDLHGQHEHQSLQKPLVQQQLLDGMLADQDLLTETRYRFAEWKQLAELKAQALDQSAEKQQRIDLLKLYTRELQELDLKVGEFQDLQDEYNRLSHAGQIMQSMSSIIGDLYEQEDFNIQSRLSACSLLLQQLTELDSSLGEPDELLKNALIQIEEAASELRSYHDNIDLDPARLDWLNNRINEAQGLARKHQLDADQLPEFMQNLELELEQLQLSEQDIEKIDERLNAAEQQYLSSARQLSDMRKETALKLSGQISAEMQTLGMQGGQFEIQLTRDENPQHFSRDGVDKIVFLVSANPGQPLKPMSRVASGGELSRISLAIQVILSESSLIPTLIFDEVDSGIGGGIAEVVGRKLRQIALNRQVFCVTHLPQVASQAHHHYQVTKTKTDSTTTTEVVTLDQQQRLEEIARMLGGMTITNQTRAHAQEMLDSVV